MTFYNIENRNCCQSDCTVPPETVKLTLDIINSPDYVFGDASNKSWLNIYPNDYDLEGTCDSEPIKGTTATALNLAKMARQLTSLWMNQNSHLFNTYTNETLVSGDERITILIDRYRYLSETGFDPCNGFQIQVCSEYAESEPICYRKAKFTMLSIPSGTGTYVLQIAFTCSTAFYDFYIVMKMNPSNMDEAINDIINEINIFFPNWQYEINGTEITIYVPCTDTPICSCNTSDVFSGNTSIVVGSTGTLPNIYFNPTVECENRSEVSGEEFDLDATLSIDVSCCNKCLNPYGYAHIQIRLVTGIFEKLRIFYTDCPSASPVIVDYNALIDYTGHPFAKEKAVNKLAMEINSSLYGDAFATTKGDVITIFFRADAPYCSCDNIYIEYDNLLTPQGHTINKTIDCCAGAGQSAIVQAIGKTISENILCCNDYFIGVDVVDCCNCTQITAPYDIAEIVECWGVGKKYEPYLRFFQNYVIDPAEIPVECFGLKLYTEDGQSTFTQCFTKEKCLPTLLFCSEYADGKTDCNGNIYGLPDEGCNSEECEFPTYNNCYRIYGELIFDGVEIETENNIKTSTDKWRITTPPLPPYVINKLLPIIQGKNLTINGHSMTFAGTIDQNIENGKMFSLNIKFDGNICKTNHNCE